MQADKDYRITQSGNSKRGSALVGALILLAVVFPFVGHLAAFAQEDTRAVGTLRIYNSEPGDLRVSWESPTDTPHDYRISWTRVGEDFLTWSDSRGNAFPTAPSYTITGLDQGVRYKVKVRARYNGSSGPWTEPVEVVVAFAPAPTATHTPVPTATETPMPTDTPTATNSATLTPTATQENSRAVVAIAVGSFQPGTLTVSWNAPTETPHDYRISWARADQNFPSWRDNSANAYPTSTSYTITGLDEGVRYKVRVRARYNGSAGLFSAAVEAVVALSPTPTPTPTFTVVALAEEEIEQPTPTATATSTPTTTATATPTPTPEPNLASSTIPGIEVSSPTAGEISVLWLSPVQAPTDYQLNWAKASEDYPALDGSVGVITQTARSITLTGLDEGVEYKVQVRARYYGGGYASNPQNGPWKATRVTVSGTVGTGLESNWEPTPTPTPTAKPVVTDHIGDRTVLVNLYYATGGRDWLQRGNWLSSEPMGNWYGVETDENGRVTKLALVNNRLGRTLPSTLRQLAELRELDLSHNSLSGSIPSQLGQVTKLEELDLSYNDLSGPVPPQLGSLGNLKKLDLAENELSGSVPSQLGSLSNLKELNLNFNSLSGSIPSQLGQLANLELLKLVGNSLGGSIPSQIGSLANLKVLHLYFNNLSGSIPSQLGQLAKLEELNLASNSLSGSVPSQLGSLSKLKDLHLCCNNLSGPIPVELGNLADLERLHFGENKSLGGSIPSALGNLTKLKVLDISTAGLSGLIPSQLGSLSKLERLDLSVNDLSGSIPSQLGNLAKLERLELFANDLSGSIPSQLGSLAKLERLYLHYNELTGSIPTELGNLTKLKWLYLNGNELSGCVPASLRAMENTDFDDRGFDLPFCE